MAAEHKPEPELSLFTTPPNPEERRSWVVFAIVAFVLVVVLALVILATRGPVRRPRSGPPPYAAQLAIGDLKVSQVQNFVGATVTYLDGTITNNGDQTLTRATVEATFRNSLGEVVDRPELPVQILRRTGVYPEALGMQVAPLAPHQTSEFRLTFEHISADWNQQTPELRVVDLQSH